MTRVFHFSDDGSIDAFLPRAVRVPAKRADGMEWLNGPLVWAIDEWHQPMYLFPRDCPRIVIWPIEGTRQKDLRDYFGTSCARMVAYIEADWLPRLQTQALYRYELPQGSFQSLEDAGMWVSRETVRPLDKVLVENLPGALDQNGVELRTIDSLTALRGVWETSLHASGIRLRHAKPWRG
jgi:hypothetical protein